MTRAIASTGPRRETKRDTTVAISTPAMTPTISPSTTSANVRRLADAIAVQSSRNASTMSLGAGRISGWMSKTCTASSQPPMMIDGDDRRSPRTDAAAAANSHDDLIGVDAVQHLAGA